jgi:hypothetical protein
MALLPAPTSVPNNPANNLLAYYPNVSNLLTVQFLRCDPLNGNYSAASGRDLVTFEAIEAADAMAWVSTTTFTAGQVVNVASGSPPANTAYIAIANAGVNLNQPPASSPLFWALYVDAEATVTIFSAPDACTGRTANVTDYQVPVFETTQQAVEFLVLPSSVFTQANGQVQFQASSNLVFVYVRSL